MPDYIYHRGARHTIGPDRDEAEATPCLGAQDVCAAEEPQMVELRPAHHVACHFPVVDDSPTPQ